MFKVNNKDTRTMSMVSFWNYAIGVDLVSIVNVENISHVILVFLLLTLSMQLPAGIVSWLLTIWCLIAPSKDIVAPLRIARLPGLPPLF